MERLQGEVACVKFHCGANGYEVVSLKDERLGKITVVGENIFPMLRSGDKLCADAELVVHQKYGEQYEIKNLVDIRRAEPLSWAECVRQYLKSEVSGVGADLAGRIVQEFGEKTIDIMDSAPDRLLGIRGASAAKLAKITKSWREGRKDSDNIIRLLQYGVGMKNAKNICKRYGPDAADIVRANPYSLADDFQGIGFQSADEIAHRLDVADDNRERLRSGIKHQLGANGNCCAPRTALIKETADTLDVPEVTVGAILRDMVAAGELKQETGVLIGNEPVLYRQDLYEAECGVAERVARMAQENVPLVGSRSLAAAGGVQYSPEQQEAICTALTHRVMVLTGGPGTGKTTVISGIIGAFQAEDKTALLAAPTGRAAKRMEEVTDLGAKTIHRLLEYGPVVPGSSEWVFKRNRDRPLAGDVLIVDEFSMVGISLMHRLLDAVPGGMTVILAGDVDQLPSVEAGNVLKDIIDSGVVPVVRLEYNFRQARGSGIIMNANRINQGQMIALPGGYRDFWFVYEQNPAEAARRVAGLCAGTLPNAFGWKTDRETLQNIQVISPKKIDKAGAEALNRLLQQAFNQNTRAIWKGGTKFILYDKVMQIKNDYDKDVFNGDIGVISDIDTQEHTLTVRFEGDKDVPYDYDDLDELKLAYATTVHKAQGGEFPVVVIPLVMEHGRLLQRNLLYTAVTRATQAVVIVGDPQAVRKAIENNVTEDRNTLLAWRLQRAARCGQSAV